MSDTLEENKSPGLFNFLGDGDTAFKVRYYKTEACENISTAVILSGTIKEASNYAEDELAPSINHILSVEEVSQWGFVPLETIFRCWEKLEELKNEYGEE